LRNKLWIFFTVALLEMVTPEGEGLSLCHKNGLFNLFMKNHPLRLFRAKPYSGFMFGVTYSNYNTLFCDALIRYFGQKLAISLHFRVKKVVSSKRSV